MITTFAVIVVSLLSAMGFTVAAEWLGSRGAVFAVAAVFAMYGVCVGSTSVSLVYFFSLSELIVLVISIPLGALAFLALALMAG